MNYFRKHFRGEYSLSVSFWVNLIFINIFIWALGTWSPIRTLNIHPKRAALSFLILLSVWLLLLYPWQVIGTWRACQNHIKKQNTSVWARSIQLFIIMTVLIIIFNLRGNWPAYSDIYKMAFKKDPLADYTLTLKKDDTLIHMAGNFGFGLTNDIAALLKKNPEITGIILDSPGGRLYEGRQLAKLIMQNNLDTYTLKGCYSACSTAFIGGKRRHLATGSFLGFHAYGLHSQNLRSFVDIENEQNKDLQIYKQQGVSKEFQEKLFSSSHDNMWYPDLDVLTRSNIIHEVVSGPDIAPSLFQITSSKLEEALLKLPPLSTIKKHDPTAYIDIQKAIQLQISQGLDAKEIQKTLAAAIEPIAVEKLSKTSHQALVLYGQVFLEFLRLLEQEDPALCQQTTQLGQFASASMTEHLPHDQLGPMLRVFSQIIVDAYEHPPPQVDQKAAEETLHEISAAMKVDSDFISAPNGQSKKDVQKNCSNAIKLYEAILQHESTTASNTLRYLIKKDN